MATTEKKAKPPTKKIQAAPKKPAASRSPTKKATKNFKLAASMKGNRNSVGNKGGHGRPTTWSKEYPEIARKLSLLGLSDNAMAIIFGVSETTFSKWKRVRPELREALALGREKADAEVAASLYERAVGHSHASVKIMVVNGGVAKVPFTEYYPPDVTAQIKWLSARQRDRWRESKEEKPSADPDASVRSQAQKIADAVRAMVKVTDVDPNA